MQVKIAQYNDIKQDSERCDPCTTTRVYWCLGLGDTPEALAQQATVKHIFRAILHLAKKPPLPSPPLPPPEEAVPPPTGEADQPAAGAKPLGKAPEKKVSMAAPTVPAGEAPRPTPLPPFIEQLVALAKASPPDHPARGVPVVDALYEDPPVEAAPVLFPSFRKAVAKFFLFDFGGGLGVRKYVYRLKWSMYVGNKWKGLGTNKHKNNMVFTHVRTIVALGIFGSLIQDYPFQLPFSYTYFTQLAYLVYFLSILRKVHLPKDGITPYFASWIHVILFKGSQLTFTSVHD